MIDTIKWILYSVLVFPKFLLGYRKIRSLGDIGVVAFGGVLWAMFVVSLLLALLVVW